jgi:hypothetical protein
MSAPEWEIEFYGGFLRLITTGPVIEAIHEARKTQDDDELEESLREDLAEDIQTNDQALVRKARLFNGALTFLVLAIVVELAGRLQ